MRRALAALAAAAGLLAAVPGAQAAPSGRVEVVVELSGQPVSGRVPFRLLRGADGHYSSQAFATRLALAQVANEQAAVARRLRLAVPDVRVSRRLQVVLNALVVQVRPAEEARLQHVAGVRRIYQSWSYGASTDRVPTVIDAVPLWGTAPGTPGGSQGDGIRIGIIDDGIDVSRPSFSGTGFSYPPGFPKGIAGSTNGKIIVARSFPPPGQATAEAKLPFDPHGSEHGTHVSGIAAGDYGITGITAGDVRVPNLSGVAPRAYLGNYRVLTVQTSRFGLDGNGAEIAEAIDQAVKDGMDVLNISLGEPEVDAGRDPVIPAIRGAARAGVVTTVSAGNDGDEGGDGTIGSPATAPEAISVGATTNDRFFGVPVTRDRAGRGAGEPGRDRRDPERPDGDPGRLGHVRDPAGGVRLWRPGRERRAAARPAQRLVLHRPGRYEQPRRRRSGRRQRPARRPRVARRRGLPAGARGVRPVAHAAGCRGHRRRRLADPHGRQADPADRVRERRPRDLVLVARPDGDLPAAEARRLGPRPGRALDDPRRLRAAERHQHGGPRRGRRRGDPAPAPPDVDGAGHQVGADAQREAGLRGHGQDHRGPAVDRRRRPDRRRGGRHGPAAGGQAEHVVRPHRRSRGHLAGLPARRRDRRRHLDGRRRRAQRPAVGDGAGRRLGDAAAEPEGPGRRVARAAGRGAPAQPDAHAAPPLAGDRRPPPDHRRAGAGGRARHGEGRPAARPRPGLPLPVPRRPARLRPAAPVPGQGAGLLVRRARRGAQRRRRRDLRAGRAAAPDGPGREPARRRDGAAAGPEPVPRPLGLGRAGDGGAPADRAAPVRGGRDDARQQARAVHPAHLDGRSHAADDRPRRAHRAQRPAPDASASATAGAG